MDYKVLSYQIKLKQRVIFDLKDKKKALEAKALISFSKCFYKMLHYIFLTFATVPSHTLFSTILQSP